jgi:PKD repeat protein
MKTRFLFLGIIILSLFKNATSQNTVVIQPGPEGKDALVWSAYPDYHFGNSPKFDCMAWSHYRETCITRALVEFDLSAVPASATITDARLNLYYASPEPNVSGHSGNNESWLLLITEPWEEDYVTWRNQPATTNDYQVHLPASTNPFMDYTNIDVTAMVTKQFTEPGHYHGLMLKLAEEISYRRLLFASGDYTDTVEFRPKLEITYILTSDTIIIQPGAEGKDAMLSSLYPNNNYGNSTKFMAMAWTHSGEPGDHRAIVDFDLSQIPDHALIEDARLNLYFVNQEPTFYGHTGVNDAWIRLITQPWEEMTVTWNNQPETTTDFQLYLPPSTDPFMDYTDIDVTALISKLYAEPETYDGLMLRLVTEDYYRCLLFASSDYNDTVEMRPKLQVIYSICEGPVAAFSYIDEGLVLHFEDQSQLAEAYWWNLGDGYYSDLANPWHIYDLAGTYEVCLTTWNECGVDSVCQPISINISDNLQVNDDQSHEVYPDPVNNNLAGTYGPNEIVDRSIFKVYPNPAKNQVNVMSDMGVQAKLQLFDTKGQCLIDKMIDFSEYGIYTINTSDLPAGTFCLRVSSGKNTISKIIILAR